MTQKHWTMLAGFGLVLTLAAFLDPRVAYALLAAFVVLLLVTHVTQITSDFIPPTGG